MRERVIQFGEGVFLRGFFDWILQRVNEATGFDAGAVVIQPRPGGRCAELERRGCRYTLLLRGLRGGVPVEERYPINTITRTVDPYEDCEGYLRLAENPDFRFVVSNTTEAGIAYLPGDALAGTPPKSFPAKVAALLWRRYKAGLPGFIFLPCELIEHNGAALRECVLRYAADWSLGEGFARWVTEENVFCDTLVDRIVTGYDPDAAARLPSPDPLLDTAELYHLWVIETDYPLLNEFPLDKAGLNVIVTRDGLARYRERKVRILNGAHTCLAAKALLRGVGTVRECMEDPELSGFAERCVTDEIIPTLSLPESELTEYAGSVFERFRNPFLRHKCSAIALNSVSKFRTRVVPSLLIYREKFGAAPPRLCEALGCLIKYYKTGSPDDDAACIAAVKGGSVGGILADTELWGADLSPFAPEVAKYVN